MKRKRDFICVQQQLIKQKIFIWVELWIMNFPIDVYKRQEANSYLSQRHLSKDIIDYFEIGYAPEQNILLKAFEKSGFSRMQAYESGLVIESGVGYDRYSNRIMFPLHNSEGRVVGFSGDVYKRQL